MATLKASSTDTITNAWLFNQAEQAIDQLLDTRVPAFFERGSYRQLERRWFKRWKTGSMQPVKVAALARAAICQEVIAFKQAHPVKRFFMRLFNLNDIQWKMHWAAQQDCIAAIRKIKKVYLECGGSLSEAASSQDLMSAIKNYHDLQVHADLPKEWGWQYTLGKVKHHLAQWVTWMKTPSASSISTLRGNPMRPGGLLLYSYVHEPYRARMQASRGRNVSVQPLSFPAEMLESCGFVISFFAKKDPRQITVARLKQYQGQLIAVQSQLEKYSVAYPNNLLLQKSTQEAVLLVATSRQQLEILLSKVPPGCTEEQPIAVLQKETPKDKIALYQTGLETGKTQGQQLRDILAQNKKLIADLQSNQAQQAAEEKRQAQIKPWLIYHKLCGFLQLNPKAATQEQLKNGLQLFTAENQNLLSNENEELFLVQSYHNLLQELMTEWSNGEIPNSSLIISEAGLGAYFQKGQIQRRELNERLNARRQWQAQQAVVIYTPPQEAKAAEAETEAQAAESSATPHVAANKKTLGDYVADFMQGLKKLLENKVKPAVEQKVEENTIKLSEHDTLVVLGFLTKFAMPLTEVVTFEEVKKAYLDAVKKMHPDRVPELNNNPFEQEKHRQGLVKMVNIGFKYCQESYEEISAVFKKHDRQSLKIQVSEDVIKIIHKHIMPHSELLECRLSLIQSYKEIEVSDKVLAASLQRLAQAEEEAKQVKEQARLEMEQLRQKEEQAKIALEQLKQREEQAKIALEQLKQREEQSKQEQLLLLKETEKMLVDEFANRWQQEKTTLLAQGLDKLRGKFNRPLSSAEEKALREVVEREIAKTIAQEEEQLTQSLRTLFFGYTKAKFPRAYASVDEKTINEAPASLAINGEPPIKQAPAQGSPLYSQVTMSKDSVLASPPLSGEGNAPAAEHAEPVLPSALRMS